MFSLKVDDELELTLPYEDRAKEAYSVIMANYDHLRDWTPWLNKDFSLAVALDAGRKNIEKFESGVEIYLRIIYKGKVAGTITLHEIDKRNRSAEIGYWLSKDHTGRGLVIRSVKRLLEHAFDELELNRIVIKCVPENLKSRAIPEKLGFAREGIERQGGWIHTKFVDHIVYSLLVDEWRQNGSFG